MKGFVQHFTEAKAELERTPTPTPTPAAPDTAQPDPDDTYLRWDQPKPGPDLSAIQILGKMTNPAEALVLADEWRDQGEIDEYDHKLALEEIHDQHGAVAMKRARAEAYYIHAERKWLRAEQELDKERDAAIEKYLNYLEQNEE